MINLPQAFIDNIAPQLGNEWAAFEASLHTSSPISIRFNPFKKNTINNAQPKVLWNDEAVYLSERPVFTLDPRFHAGAYYVQEASSMLVGWAVSQLCDSQKPLRVLDLCAAPGGKSTLLSSVIHADSLLICNEVIKSRVGVLKENIQKWGMTNIHLTNHDPEDFAHLQGFFDLILVDAPCSGEGLFRKAAAAVDEWSEQNVQVCGQRQQRILSAIVPLLAVDGLLVYSTCTYNNTENQANASWLCETKQLKHIDLNLPQDWNVCTQPYGYQCYPHRVRGEGFYFAVFRNNTNYETDWWGRSFKSFKKVKPSQATELRRWLQNPDIFSFYVKPNDEIVAIQTDQIDDLIIIDNTLKNKGLGLTMGVFKGQDFIPDHALALSVALSQSIATLNLTKSEALQFLKKENLTLDTPKGWLIAQYEGLALGWAKGLGNRMNNYLPKDWRIRMEIPGS
jgi:16S rRNA C967 or C1407 C5-methylase (RsmB/RsmF family)/NOL1/NOP2/fmu family ribosome biogenesis protein